LDTTHASLLSTGGFLFLIIRDNKRRSRSMFSRIPVFIKRIIPWLMAAVILAYEFYHIDRDLFIYSLKTANLFIYVPLIIIFVFIWFFIETYNLQKLYQYFSHPVDYFEMLKMRGATFLLMIVNYGLGMGGVALYMKKFSRVSLIRSTGMFFYYMVVETSGIALLAIAGFMLSGDTTKIQDWILYLSAGVFIFYSFEIVFFKFMPPVGFLKKFINSRFVAPMRETNWSIYFGIFFQRIGYFITFIFFFYFAVRSFNMDIPFYVLTALVPIIFFIGNLPITPFGLGTIQAGMLYLFRDYGSEANILALSILYSVSLLIIRAVIGLYCLRFVKMEIPASEEVIAEAAE
jgi:uncharacterized membrane protein YbhN (UPF0104 family)